MVPYSHLTYLSDRDASQDFSGTQQRKHDESGVVGLRIRIPREVLLMLLLISL
jgi:hypothetical protein